MSNIDMTIILFLLVGMMYFIIDHINNVEEHMKEAEIRDYICSEGIRWMWRDPITKYGIDGFADEKSAESSAIAHGYEPVYD